VDFLAHAIAERAIHDLVTLNEALALKQRRDDQGLEVLAVATHLEYRALKALSNITPDIIGGRHRDLTV
jgi:uncharacterized protein (UPF0264 family)